MRASKQGHVLSVEDVVQKAAVLADAAVTEPVKWAEYLSLVADASGAEGIAIFSPGIDPRRERFAQVAGNFSGGGLAAFQTFWAAHDPWLLAVAGKRFFDTAGDVRFGTEFLPDSVVKRTPYYNEYGRFEGCGHKVALKVCDGSDTEAPVVHFTLGRRYPRNPFSNDQKALLRQLWPTLQRAVRGHYSVGHFIGAAPHEAMLDVVPNPVILLSAGGHIEFLNAAARDLAVRSLLSIDRHGHLQGIGDLDSGSLKSLVRTVLRRGSGCEAAAFDADKRHRFLVRFVALTRATHVLAAWPRAALLLSINHVTPGEQVRWLGAIANHYRLTATERLVLDHIAGGRTVEEITAQMGIAEGTVRTHLAALREKTGRRRVTELMALALGR